MIKEYEDLNKILTKIESNTILLPMFDTKAEIINLIKLGISFGATNEIRLGERSQCHENSVDQYLKNEYNENLNIVSGFALSEDGLWRSHSWIVKDNSFVIETTEKRLRYFGFVYKDTQDIQDFISLIKG